MDRHNTPSSNLVADAVMIDFAANAIRIRVPDYATMEHAAMSGTLDVGANGRLIGLEIDDRYISVMDLPGADETYVRSAEVTVRLTPGSPPWISIPRRGAGYEITYPSGNECWQMTNVNGELIQVCAVRAEIDGAPSAHRDALERQTTHRHHAGTGRERPGQP